MPDPKLRARSQMAQACHPFEGVARRHSEPLLRRHGARLGPGSRPDIRRAQSCAAHRSTHLEGRAARAARDRVPNVRLRRPPRRRQEPAAGDHGPAFGPRGLTRRHRRRPGARGSDADHREQRRRRAGVAEGGASPPRGDRVAAGRRCRDPAEQVRELPPCGGRGTRRGYAGHRHRGRRCPEIVETGVTGLLVPPGDSRAFGGAMASLVEEPELRESLREGARAVSGRYRVEPIFEALEQELAMAAIRR